MAFDQNAIPKDLRPLNIVRAVTDDPCIATGTSTGRPAEDFHANLPRDGSPNSIVYYTPTASDPGYVCHGPSPVPAPAPAPGPVPMSGVAAVAAWVPHVVTPPPVAATGVVNVGSGAVYGHINGARSISSPSDHASDEGGDGSVSGRKVKFMCSFGGNIRPRPGDGALRYVGGQTRIISVRRGITFEEFVQKMINIYGQRVVIKYQLPDEDLDALVSVSCADDLDNMMEEYEKMVERSSDGSAKLRIFLFSSSEADSASIVHIGDWHVNAQKYVEAVNGLADGSGRDIIFRKESNASAASTQSSDIYPTEVAEGRGFGDITSPMAVGVPSPRENPTASQESMSRNSCGDRSPIVHVSAVPVSHSSIVQSGIPVSNFGCTPMSLHTETSFPVNAQQERVVELQHAFPTASPYWYAYGGPQPENSNRSDFVQTPSQMGFPAPLMGAVSPVYTQQQINATNPAHQQFLHMTMVPSSNPNMVQSQQILLEPYPGESSMGQRVVHMPADQGNHAYHAQVPHAMVGGAYGWQQIPQAEHVAFSEGFMPRQQVVAQVEFSRVEDCYMCQKALPHAHSDTIAQDNRESPSSRIPDLKPIYHSLQLDDEGRPVNKHLTAGAFGEPSVEQRGTGPQSRVAGNDADNQQFEGNRIPQNAEVHYDMDKIIHQRAENSELPRLPVQPNATGIIRDMQPPYGIVVGTIPQTSTDSASLQSPSPTHYQLMQDSAGNKSPIADSPTTGAMPLQSSDYVLHESPKAYSGNILVSVATEDISKPTYDHIQQIGGRLENLQVSPPEMLVVTEPSKSPNDNPKREDILESRPQQVAGGETYLDAFNKPRSVLDVDHLKLKEMPSSSLHEAPCMPNLQQAEYHEATQPPLLVDAGMYGQSKLGVNLVPDENSAHNPSSAVDSSHSSEIIPPIIDWQDTAPVYLPNTISSGGEVQSDASSSVSPSYLIEDLHESSNSLFSNQDPWGLRMENHFPPPRPSKIQLSKESFGARDDPGDNRFDNMDFLMGNNNGVVTGDRVSSAYTNLDAGSEHSQLSKGSAEKLIKEELQAVAEGVAASVLQTPATSNVGHVQSDETSLSIQNNEVNIIDKEVNNDILEEVKARVPEKINPGLPVADGHLQIIKNGDLEEIKELGSGTFGTVYYGKWRGTDVAIKRINDRCFAGKPSEVQRMRDDFWNEANILADLHHPNVVAFYGVVLDGPGGSFATVTEYMVNGSLRTALQKSERNLDKRKRILIAMDVAFGMEYLHGKKIVHFDLKSDNLLVNLRDPHRPICKVGDLGLSKVKCQTLISGGVRGTLPWMAPELLNGSSNLVSEKVDVYSFGIVMWELLTGEEPYADLHYGAIIGGIVSNTLRPAVPESCDSDWKSLMERCWAAEPSGRPTFPEVANELRTMASKIPPKGQQQAASKQAQAKS